jgi:hypothetical protein
VKLEKAQSFYQRYDYWSLLLSCVPIIGDPTTLVAGVMREAFWRFLLLITQAKGGRYLLLTVLVLGSTIGHPRFARCSYSAFARLGSVLGSVAVQGLTRDTVEPLVLPWPPDGAAGYSQLAVAIPSRPVKADR